MDRVTISLVEGQLQYPQKTHENMTWLVHPVVVLENGHPVQGRWWERREKEWTPLAVVDARTGEEFSLIHNDSTSALAHSWRAMESVEIWQMKEGPGRAPFLDADRNEVAKRKIKVDVLRDWPRGFQRPHNP